MTTEQQPGHALTDGKRYLSGWRSAAPAMTLALIALVLAALAVTPIVLMQQLDDLREGSANTTMLAVTQLDSLRLSFSEDVFEHLRMRQSESADARTRYLAARARETSLLDELARVAPAIDSTIPPRVAQLRQAVDAWHDLPDRRARGLLSEADFERSVAEVRERRLAALDAHSVLETEVRAIEARHRARGGAMVARQRDISSALGVVGILAALGLGFFAGRERRLTRQLAASVEVESRLRAESEQRREDLERITESKARLMRGFSHDVKNPIGAAMGYLSLLKEGAFGPLTPEQHGSIDRANRSLRAALHLIGDLLELAKADTGHIEVQRLATDLREVAREAAEEYRAQAEANGLAMHVEIDDDAPPIESDPMRVRQVLGNLISNAVKYTEHGTVTVSLTSCADGARANDRVHIVVRDTGNGIPREKQRLLFREFVRLDPMAGPGAGLGLAISAKIVQALGGELSVTSEPGEGSVFVLSLPTRAPAGGEPAFPADEARPQGARSSPL